MILHYKKISSFFLAFCIFSAAYGQQINTMYFMEPVPQRYELNPAFQPSCIDLFIGVPVLSTIQVYGGNTPLPLFKLMVNKNGSLEFNNPTIGANIGMISNYLRMQNFFFANAQVNLLSFGYRESKDLFFNFSLSSKVSSNLSVNKDMFNLLFKTDSLQGSYNLYGSGAEATAYKELAFGISYKVSNNFTHGGRLKILFGDANLGLRISKCTFYVDTNQGSYAYGVNANVKLNGSAPYTNVYFDNNGYLSTSKSVYNMTPMDYLFNFRNPGLAIDYGFVYKPIEDMTISASVIDLGFIHWGMNVFNNTLNQDHMTYLNQSIPYTFLTKNLLDDVRSTYPADSSRNPYFSWLSAKVFLGTSVYFRKDLSMGLVSRTEIFRSRLYEQMVISANYYPIKNIAATLSYSFVNNGLTSIGAGINARLGAMNFYLITDNIPFRLTYYPVSTSTTGSVEKTQYQQVPDRIKAIGFRLGINIAFGCRKIRDIPSCE